MKGHLLKENNQWIVEYWEGLKPYEFLLHPEDVKRIDVNGFKIGTEVNFQILDYSQCCKECGEIVQRGYSCKKGCFMRSGNFVSTEKLEYAKIIENPKKIYESPDKGDTVYERDFFDYKNKKQII